MERRSERRARAARNPARLTRAAPAHRVPPPPSPLQAFIHYLITCNIGEVVAILLSSLLSLPDILSPLQLLWVNLVTDGPPATALGFNPAEKGLMLQRPRGYDESLLPPFTLFRLGLTGLYIGGACVGAFAHSYQREQGVGFAELLDWANCKSWVATPAGGAAGAAAAAAASSVGSAGKAAGGAALSACSLFGEHSDARAKASSMALSVRSSDVQGARALLAGWRRAPRPALLPAASAPRQPRPTPLPPPSALPSALASCPGAGGGRVRARLLRAEREAVAAQCRALGQSVSRPRHARAGEGPRPAPRGARSPPASAARHLCALSAARPTSAPSLPPLRWAFTA